MYSSITAIHAETSLTGCSQVAWHFGRAGSEAVWPKESISEHGVILSLFAPDG